MVHLRRMKKPTTSTTHERMPDSSTEAADTNPEVDKENSKAMANSRNFGNDISNKIPDNICGKRNLRENFTRQTRPEPPRASCTSYKRNRPKLKIKQDPLRHLSAWDRSRLHDPQQVSIYADDIVLHMLTLEKDPYYKRDSDYLSRHQELNQKIRKIVIKWLIEINFLYRMKEEVLYLSVNIFDRFLSKKEIKDFKRDDVQLLALSAMLIASKFEEIYPPSIQKLMYHCEDSVTLNQVLEIEGLVLKTLDFKLIGPSANWFFNRFAEICDFNKEMKSLGKCLLDLSLLSYKALEYKTSVLAASAVFVSMKMKTKEDSESMLKERIGICVEDMKNCPKLLIHLYWKLKSKDENYAEITNKYGVDLI